ncbi:MAG: MgtC/SapB family protein [Mycobacteriaceae bacterium]
MDLTELHVLGYAAALLIGLGLGIEREHNAGAVHAAGSGTASTPFEFPGARTFPLIAFAGAIAAHLGSVIVAVGFIGVSLVILAWYWVRAHSGEDPDTGTTTSVAALTAFLLGALAWQHPSLAVGLGVVVLALLAVKYPIHEFANRMIDQRDITDFCVLLAVAFLALPLLPDRNLGPYGALNPSTIGTLVLMLSLIGWAGYVAMRLLGDRWGLLIVGFGGGFVSASATIAVMARMAKTTPDARDTLPAALIANLSTIIQVVAITWVVNTQVSKNLALIFGGAALLIAAETAFLVFRSRSADNNARSDDSSGGFLDRPISLKATLSLTGILLILLIATRAAADWLGSTGAIAAAAIGGLADAHSSSLAAASAVGATLSPHSATLAAGAALGTNLIVKLTLAALAGPRVFAVHLTLWLIPPAGASVAALWLLPF